MLIYCDTNRNICSLLGSTNFEFGTKRLTVKLVLRGNQMDPRNIVLLDMWPHKRGSFHINISMSGQENWPLKTGDCLIEMTAWAGLIVYWCYYCVSETFRQIFLKFSFGYQLYFPKLNDHVTIHRSLRKYTWNGFKLWFKLFIEISLHVLQYFYKGRNNVCLVLQ